MKTKYFNIFLLTFVLAGFGFSCTDDNSIDDSYPIVGLGGDDYPKNYIDEWLYEQFTVPYNIEVKYRWNPYDYDISLPFVPPYEENVIPVMELIRDVWINTYKDLMGEEFIRKYAPKNYALVGNVKITSSGSRVTGEAEGGNRVTIYRVNWWNPNDHTNADEDKRFENLVPLMLKTVHHEFTHTLNQIVKYPEEFIRITPEYRLDEWATLYYQGDDAVRDAGFISAYASCNPAEDFAEIVSLILVKGQTWFDTRVAMANSTVKLPGSEYTAQEALRLKETIVVSYLKNSWGIDLYGTDEQPGLEKLVQQAMKNYLDTH
ncbi:MAG: putative zinc-binding metallopeptidase [Dysgonamonadaceae bacterium]|jgi:substrate import-associated zinc metallohydrolase lipoprotein|nr:putative zinc-binding metallopeptidase [Dysgonamonadaceae bacterium]